MKKLNQKIRYLRTTDGVQLAWAEAGAGPVMNLGTADYNGLQTNFVYRGHRKIFASLSYTLSKATNTTEPDGNGINPNQSIITRLGEEENGPSVVDQRHRAVVTFHYRFP